MNDNWRYFLRTMGGFYACHSEGGYIVCGDLPLNKQMFTRKYNVEYCQKSIRSFGEVGIYEALSRRIPLTYHEDILDFFAMSTKVDLSEKLIKKCLTTLKERGAFNGDSALRIDGEEFSIYYALMKQELINVSPLDNHMFYLK